MAYRGHGREPFRNSSSVTAAQVGIERRLHVALEHLERQGHRRPACARGLRGAPFEAVGVRIVVLLADQNDVGAGEVGEHHFEVGEAPRAGIDRRAAGMHTPG